jgi:hypothetical protein
MFVCPESHSTRAPTNALLVPSSTTVAQFVADQSSLQALHEAVILVTETLYDRALDTRVYCGES